MAEISFHLLLLQPQTKLLTKGSSMDLFLNLSLQFGINKLAKIRPSPPPYKSCDPKNNIGRGEGEG